MTFILKSPRRLIKFLNITNILLIFLVFIIYFGFYYSSPLFRRKVDSIKYIGVNEKKVSLGRVNFICNPLNKYDMLANVSKKQRFRFGILIAESVSVSTYNNDRKDYSSCQCLNVKDNSKDVCSEISGLHLIKD